MEMIYSFLSGIRWLKRPFWKSKRFLKRLYYGFTDFLMILGGSVLLFGVWYFLFYH